MTCWQALCALVSAILFDDSLRTRAHTANGWTHPVSLIVESHKTAWKNFEDTSSVSVFMTLLMFYLSFLATMYALLKDEMDFCVKHKCFIYGLIYNEEFIYQNKKL